MSSPPDIHVPSRGLTLRHMQVAPALASFKVCLEREGWEAWRAPKLRFGKLGKEGSLECQQTLVQESWRAREPAVLTDFGSGDLENKGAWSV